MKIFAIVLLMVLQAATAWADKAPANLLGKWTMYARCVDNQDSYEVTGGYISFFEPDHFEQMDPEIALKGKPQMGTYSRGTFSVSGRQLKLGDRLPWTYSLTKKGKLSLLTLSSLVGGRSYQLKFKR